MQFNRTLGPLRVRGDARAVVAGAVLFALLLNLGFWQLGRAGEKLALEARWQAQSDLPPVTPQVILSGNTDGDAEQWAGDPSRRTLPEPTLSQEPMIIEGNVYAPSGKPFLMQKPEAPQRLPAVVQTLYWDRWSDSLSALTERKVLPYEIRIQPGSEGALVADWPRANSSSSKHIGYAVQWFAMAAVLAVIGVVRMTNVRALLKGS